MSIYIANGPGTGGTSISLTTTGTSGAATLVGSVLNIPVYSAGSGGISRTITSISTPTTAGATASTDYYYGVTGTTTLTLPTAVGNTNLYVVKCISGTTTIATTSAQTIDGSSSVVITVANTSISMVSDSSNWLIV